jgi:hypothetical protein
MLSRGVPVFQPPVEIAGIESRMSFPDRQHYPCVATLVPWGPKRILFSSTGKGLLEALHLDSSRPLLMHFSPLLILLCMFHYNKSQL